MLDTVPDRIATGDQADAVVKAFFETGDLSLFDRHNAAMMDDATAAALAIMRGSGNELDPFQMFMAQLVDIGVITQDHSFEVLDRYVEYQRARAA